MAGHKVLLIEANDADAEGMQELFSGAGFTVVRASEGRQGIEMAAIHQPSLIVLAVELPGQSGYIACKRLKREPGLETIPLVITSSTATEETFEQHRNLKTRAEEYLHKPFTAEQLLAAASRHVAFPEVQPASEDDLQLLFDDPDASLPESDEPKTPPSPSEGSNIEMLDVINFDEVAGLGDELDVDALAGDVAAALGDLDVDLLSDDALGFGELDEDLGLDEASGAEAVVGTDAGSSIVDGDDSVAVGDGGEDLLFDDPDELPVSPMVSRTFAAPVKTVANAEVSAAIAVQEARAASTSHDGTPPTLPEPRPATAPTERIPLTSPPSAAPGRAQVGPTPGAPSPGAGHGFFEAADTGVDLRTQSADADDVEPRPIEHVALQADAATQLAGLQEEVETLRDIEATQQDTIDRLQEEREELQSQVERLGEQLANASSQAAAPGVEVELRRAVAAATARAEKAEASLSSVRAEMRQLLSALQTLLAEKIGEIDSEMERDASGEPGDASDSARSAP